MSVKWATGISQLNPDNSPSLSSLMRSKSGHRPAVTYNLLRLGLTPNSRMVSIIIKYRSHDKLIMHQTFIILNNRKKRIMHNAYDYSEVSYSTNRYQRDKTCKKNWTLAPSHTTASYIMHAYLCINNMTFTTVIVEILILIHMNKSTDL